MGELLVATPYVQISDSLKTTYSQSVQESCLCMYSEKQQWTASQPVTWI